MENNKKHAEEIVVGTVVRTYSRGCEETGTVVERDGDDLFVAWHGSFVEEQLTIGGDVELEVWADAPQELRDWRGGIAVVDPAHPERGWSIIPVPPGPHEPAEKREEGRHWGPSRDRDSYER